MDLNNLLSDISSKLKQAEEHYAESLKSLRTGRANPSMLDNVVVEAYGTTMPLKQTASISVPEAQLLQVSPYDPSNIASISTAIRNDQSLGLNPADDGHVIRIPIPPLTEERRRELAKQVGQKQEETMVSLRAIRHDAMDQIDKAKKDKVVGEDDAKRKSSQVEEAVNQTKLSIEKMAKDKESEIINL